MFWLFTFLLLLFPLLISPLLLLFSDILAFLPLLVFLALAGCCWGWAFGTFWRGGRSEANNEQYLLWIETFSTPILFAFLKTEQRQFSRFQSDLCFYLQPCNQFKHTKTALLFAIADRKKNVQCDNKVRVRTDWKNRVKTDKEKPQLKCDKYREMFKP